MITPPTTYKDLQHSFDTATLENIPHFFVDFPIWDTVKPVLTTTVNDEPKFKNSTPLKCIIELEPIIQKLQKEYPQIPHIKGGRALEMQPHGEQTDKLEKMPHPFSKTNHIDPNVTKDDKEKLRLKIKDLKDDLARLAEKDGELNNASHETLPTLERVELLLPVSSTIEAKGMQRLKLNFEWMLCQITTLFGQINLALDEKTDKPKDVYNEARRKYIALLKDLDNHEPLLGEPGKHGYGRTVKWVYFYPLIHTPDPQNLALARIKGVKVVAKWNPHISSSGVPIPHS
jgi:hypothetical protein